MNTHHPSKISVTNQGRSLCQYTRDLILFFLVVILLSSAPSLGANNDRKSAKTNLSKVQKSAKPDLSKVQILNSTAQAAAPFVYKPSGKLTGTNVSDKNHVFATRYETTHFIMLSDCDLNTTRNFAEPMEGFITFVDGHVCPVKGTYPMKFYYLKDQASMQVFLGTLGSRWNRALYGIYLRRLDACATYDGSGFGTLTHELMHKVIRSSVADYDPWANEGIPTLFEKVYGYPTKSGWNFVYGFQNPWRLKNLQLWWGFLSLKSIVHNARSGSGENESEERLVATFLNDNGKLAEYIRLIRTGDKKGYNSYLEAAFACPLEQLEPLFKRYLDSIHARFAELVEIPNSEMFWSEAEFKKFLAEHPTLSKPVKLN